jgi:microcystin-dependent protein
MEPYIGEIKMFAGTFAPNGWFNCDGGLYPISQYSALFALIGNYYGGDGQRTFAVPDLRGRAPISAGQGPQTSRYNVGDSVGVESFALTPLQMPVHTHLINTQSGAADQWSPTNLIPAGSGFVSDGTEVNTYSSKAADGTLHPKTIAPAGGSQPISIMQPVLAVTFIIAWQGIFPSRP